ncbi:MAG: hypothetical protein CVV64_01495 [Candidatus Wallbacteria bacterium HGW-Wallbacteria-1]|jgi:hypothetical protein|uniref:Fibronectin type-III domain-containing protein n=1 Tax=Candidatus Wallbacteria bacterium HGW-Wallbacteria-1 TaxID=2013854 RepID=A0A2N1PUV1_9BACT|nr:MAG: hypothetical protein CVV64_01495 [Candidatus Wallbacteria bacterium HGW-Wallbacteria-1]
MKSDAADTRFSSMNRRAAAISSSVWAFAVIVILIFMVSGCTSLQKSENSIRIPMSGKVLDSAGNAVEGAQVSIAGIPEVKACTTDEEGKYMLTDIPLGQHQVLVQKAGFQAIARGISLDGDKPVLDENFTVYTHISDLFLVKFDDRTAQAVWRSVSPTSSYLEFGPNATPSVSVTAASVGLRHALFMNDLVKSVLYTYRVKFDGASYSDDRTFKLDDTAFPPAPYLRSPLAVGHDSIKIGWTRENDDEFVSYRVYRSVTDPASGAGEELAIIEDRDVTTFTDQGLTPLSTYYYRVVTLFRNNLATAGNQLQITTEDIPNDPPHAVELKYPLEKTDSSFTLTWSRNEDSDFESYRIHYSKSTGVNLGSPLGTKVTTSSTTQAFVKGLEKDTTYYFKVFVFDTGGLSAESNEIFGTTDSSNFSPFSVTLYKAEFITTNSCTLRWSKALDSDFYSYRLYRDTGPSVTEDDFMVTEILDADKVTYLDVGLTEGINYFYKVFVVDSGSKTSGSNEIGVTILNNNPNVPLLSVTQADSSSVTLQWTRSDEVDFDHYSLYRSQSLDVPATTANLIQLVPDSGTLTFHDTNDGAGLSSNRTYYYRLVVFDLGGAGSSSDVTPATTIDSTSFSGTVDRDLIITPGNSPLRVTGDVTVTGGAVLQILGGVTVEFSAVSDSVGSGDPIRSEIIVKGGIFNRGGLIARGSQGLPVRFVSSGGSLSAPGDWGGIRIESGSYDCYFDYVVIQSATTGIRNQSNRIEVSRTMVTGCSSHGLDNLGGNPYVYSSSFTFNGGAGIHVSGGNPRILSCNITDNTDRAIYGGGGIIGATGGAQGVFIARNNSSTAVDTTGQTGTLPLGIEDGVMDTDSDALVTPIQIDNVDVIYALVYDPVSGADPSSSN